MSGHSICRAASSPLLEIDHRYLRHTASAPALEMEPPLWELAAEIPTTATTATTDTTAATTTSLLLLHDKLAANFLQLSIAIEKIKALEAQLATGNWAGTRRVRKVAKLECKLAGQLQHRDNLGTQRRRLLGKRGYLERNRGGGS